jgi:hypothetical protein
MFYPRAWQPFFIIVFNPAAKVRVVFSAKKRQYIIGAEADGRMPLQFFVQRSQCRTIFKQDIGCIFGLIGYPVILHAFEQAAHQGIKPFGHRSKDFFPALFGKFIGNFLRLLAVIYSEKCIFKLGISDPFCIQSLFQPFMAIEVDLDHKREPSLKPYMRTSVKSTTRC